jgi:hypothetical protein
MPYHLRPKMPNIYLIPLPIEDCELYLYSTIFIFLIIVTVLNISIVRFRAVDHYRS